MIHPSRNIAMRHLLPKWIRETVGQSMVETVLILGICGLGAASMYEFCAYLYDQSALASAAIAGMQYMGVHGTAANTVSPGSGCGPGTGGGATCAAVVSLVKASFAQSALQPNVSSMAVCPTWYGPGASLQGSEAALTNPSNCQYDYQQPSNYSPEPGYVIAVQVTWIYEPFFGLPFMKIPMSAVATGVVAY